MRRSSLTRAEEALSSPPGALSDGTTVTVLQKPVPIGLLARCLGEEILRARGSFWASERELIVTFPERALVCHPVAVAQLLCLVDDHDLEGAESGWVAVDQVDCQIWLELAHDEVRVLRRPAKEVSAALQLLSV